jgi:hypothetical protein
MKKIITNKNTKRMRQRGGAPPLSIIEVIAYEHLQQTNLRRKLVKRVGDCL